MSHHQNVSIRERNGKLTCELLTDPDWNDVERIAAFLEQEFAGEVVERADGVDARVWRVLVQGAVLKVVHDDPWATYLEAVDADGNNVLTAVAEKLDQLIGKPAATDTRSDR